MGRANIWFGDELVKYSMANSMTINYDIFMKSRIVGKKDYNLVITIHGHSTWYWKTKLLNMIACITRVRVGLHAKITMV